MGGGAAENIQHEGRFNFHFQARASQEVSPLVQFAVSLACPVIRVSVEVQVPLSDRCLP